MPISGKVGAVYVSKVETAPVSFSDQATTASDGYTRYQVNNASYRYWPLDANITVKKNGNAITSGFTLERAGGYVVFASALQPTDTVTVSGTALTLVQCGGFFNWKVDTDADTAEVTTFASGGWKEFMQTVKGWSGTAEAYWGDDRFYQSLGETIVVKLFIDSGASQKCLEGFAVITGDEITTNTEEVVKESIKFQGVGPLYLRA